MSTVYLLAWAVIEKEVRCAMFEVSTAKMCRQQGVIKAGVKRGDKTTIAFCDFIHGDDYLTKHELRQVATRHLDGDYDLVTYDLKS